MDELINFVIYHLKDHKVKFLYISTYIAQLSLKKKL